MSLLGRVVRKLEGDSCAVALIGGVAAAFHGVMRATKDADLLCPDDSILREERWKDLRQEGIAVDVRAGSIDDPLRGVVRIYKPHEAVDVVVGRPRWHDDVVRRARRHVVAGEEIPVVDAADLVLLKLDSAGTLDLFDARVLMRGPEGARIRRDVETRLPSLPSRLTETWDALQAEESRDGSRT